jgi:2',3'-cyclic-nucleotide 2'-phosphodiesterase / 3'-nucleotidase / 5'-nucleotidase
MKYMNHSCPRVGVSIRFVAALCAVSLCGFWAADAIAKPPPTPPQVGLSVIGSYASGIFNAGGSEIAAHDPLTQRLYVVNAQDASINVLSIANPAAPTLVATLSLIPFGGVANSVAVFEGLVAVAMEATPNRTDPGKVVFFDSAFNVVSVVTVGAIPDMLTFSHRGRYVLVANEGEPKSYNQLDSVDPEGSVSIIDLRDGAANLTQANVSTAGFTAYNGAEATLRAAGIRIYGPNATAAQDLEPEYIAVSPDDTTAWVTLQENNALATVDIASATVTTIVSLGFKDHTLPGNGLDPSDRDNAAGTGPAIKIGNWPLRGMYQADGIAAYPIGSELFLFMANEGDARTDWPGLNEEATIGASSYVLDTNVFPNASVLKQNRNLGRLRASNASGDTDSDGDFDEIHTFGGRSFSIRTTSGALVFDSGDDFEEVTAVLHNQGAVIFNASHSNNTFDDRSRSKGPEPEGIAVGRAFQRVWAVTGLERIGGVMVYDVTDPHNPRFATYANNRNFAGTFSFGTAGDLGPEGVLFIDEGDSPTGEPLVVTANEISGTTTIYQLNKL